ncbi:MAG: hypothetical protein KIH65_005030 [Candidatus Uhrbacteria bacterium]|nr:hypothetical protein [Candidatus Uhrbacteria bacterium]
MLRRFIAALCVVPWALAIAGAGWLCIQRFPPSGTVVFDLPFDGSSAWMDPFLPAERTTSPGVQEGGWRGQRILQDPVYSSARVPGTYGSMEIQVDFRPNDQHLIELGVLRDDASLSFEFQPMWFEPLQSHEWVSASSNDKTGYVRSGSSKDILSTSQFNTLAIWYASSVQPMLQDATSTPRTTTISLRGSLDIWAVPANGKISFTFKLQDSNRKQGRDAVVLQILREDEVITSTAVGIGGSRDATMGTVVEQTISADVRDAGVYRVRVVADDDVFIRSIATDVSRWVIGPRLSFGDTVGYATTSQPGIAWTDSRHFTLETRHREGMQTVRIGDGDVNVNATHRVFRFDRTDGKTTPQRVDVPAGDLRMIGDGFFSLTPEAFFVPQPRRVTVFTDLEREGIVGVVTPYERPIALGDGWYRATLRFALDPTRDHVRFALSAPGVLEYKTAVDLRRVRLTYTRPPLSPSEWLRVLRMEAANAWRRLRSSL